MGDIPEILSYLVMYLKLVPNLENSIKFAAKESNTSLGRALRKMIWDMEIRLYHGINDALVEFTCKWSQWSDHFKRAMHLIRSSIHESEEAQRIITLNKALDVGLDGTRELMSEFVDRLHQPTLIIYSIGVMIPLALIAMLPAAALIGVRITIFQVFLLYDVILPLILFLYMRSILLSRPATFNPPRIPSNHPQISSINRMRCGFTSILLGIVVSLPWIILHPSWSTPLVFLPLWGVTISVTYYTMVLYKPYKRIRDEIRSMEREFTEALYILGKRISEDKSPEEGFLYTAEIMKGSTIASIFKHTGFLLSIRNTIEEALFHSEYGSLRHVYSSRIRAVMKLLVEGVKKSQRSAGLSIIKLADHLKELQEVESRIKENLGSLTATLRSTATVFAPLIAGVTLAITRVIAMLIERMNPSSMYNAMSIFTIENVEIEYFILVVGIYVLQLVVLLTRFTNGIDEGDDKAEYMYNLGRSLPVAVAILTVSTILSQHLFSNIISTI